MVGIVNIQWFDNPGAVLLCYALQQTVKDIKKDEQVKIIDYTRGGSVEKCRVVQKVIRIFTKTAEKILYQKKIDGIKYEILLKKRHEHYEAFRSKYLDRTKPFKSISSEVMRSTYSYCIVGSDVVWKPEIAKTEVAKIYFLQFAGKNTKKIAYAASIGTDDAQLLQSLSVRYKKLITGFDAISMREKSGKDFIQSLTPIKVEEVIDPVFLLSKDDYMEMISEKRALEEAYVYVYLLSPNVEAIGFAQNLAKERGLRILFDVHTKANFKIWAKMLKNVAVSVSAGPGEFLGNIYYADYVVTDSFHGTSFSLLFHKEFFTYERINNGINISTRMENLLNKLNLQSRYCSNHKEWDLEEINYHIIDEKIAEMKDEALLFLKGALQ